MGVGLNKGVYILIPATRRSPEVSCFRQTTRLPRNLPAIRMTTVPAEIDLRSLGGLRTGVGPFLKTTSSAG